MNLIWNSAEGTLTEGFTAVLAGLLLALCLVVALWARHSLRRNRPAPYWLIRYEHRLKHLFREDHDCLDVLSDSRPKWW